MEKRKRTKYLKNILLALLLTVLVSISTITFAWFTDKKEYTGTLTFGSIELDVSGGVDNATQTLTFDVQRTLGPAYSGKVMPGDTVNINLTLGLKTGSDPAYYLIYIYDNNGVFEEALYFSQDGTNVYVNDDTKTYLQSDSTKTAVADKYCGKLTAGTNQSIQIGAKVSEDYTSQNATVTVNCKIYAIQQANLSEADAFTKLYPKVNFVTSANWKSAIPNYVNLTSIGFYDKQEATTLGFAKDTTLTTNLDAKLSESDQGNLEVWTKSSTEIAFVSDKVIMAPENCVYLFSDKTEANRLTNLKSIAFNNFNTSEAANMNSMFYACSGLTSLDVSNFNTSSVKIMTSMFNYCSELTSLDVSNFNTSSVADMSYMFYYCQSLTTLDLSNFNTSSVINMTNMFYNCKLLTSLDVSNFDTSKVTNMRSMFSSCAKLSSLDVSSFNTSSATDLSAMFGNCGELISLDISNFNTSSVKYMGSMFSGCSGLTSLDLYNLNTSAVTNMNGMFYNCKNLTNLDLSSFDTSSVTDFAYMFVGTFSNSASTSTLKISSNFTYKNDSGVATQFTKSTLNSKASLNTSVTVLKDGVALS